METYILNDGNKIPAIGFGTYKARDEEAVQAVKTALDKGYRLIDTAAIYGNEAAVGKAIQESGVPREDIFLTTKVWCDDFGYDTTRKALSESLKKLQTEYVDLYLIHWPANAKHSKNWQEINSETWRAMEDLQAEGKIKSIGLSNFWQEHLEPLFQTARVMPTVNQIEFHPGYWQAETVEYCQKHNILIEAWSPIARGKVFNHPLLISLAQKYNKTLSQICLRWIVEHGAIPIPKSANSSRIEENLQIFDFQLEESEIRQIDALPEMGFSGQKPTD